MKTKTLYSTIGIALLAVIIGISIPGHLANAQSAQGSGQALEIAPPVLNLTANPGQTIKTQINLRDVSSNKLVVSSQVDDFVASGEDGTPKILLDNKEPNPYSMKSWITPLPDFTLVPKQIQALPVIIKVPANAAPGGYYAVVRFTGTPPELKGTGVSLSASLGSLILLKVNGNAKEELAVEEFSIAAGTGKKSGWLFESTPLTFAERLKNNGNIHEQPSGQVTITDMFGKKVATLNVNLPPRNILPRSIRKFEQPLDTSVIGDKKLFGRYTANLSVSYGANSQIVTASTTFWVIPYRLIGIGIAFLVAAFIGLRFVMRRYNQHIIQKAQKKPRRK